jgi:hypothetical protein
MITLPARLERQAADRPKGPTTLRIGVGQGSALLVEAV